MKTLLSIITIISLLVVLGSAKVLLRTNPILALSIIGGGIAILAIAWTIRSK